MNPTNSRRNTYIKLAGLIADGLFFYPTSSKDSGRIQDGVGVFYFKGVINGYR